MWSGLLPPGLNESDVDLSSDDEDESPDSCSKQDAKEDIERDQGTGQENNASSEPIVPGTDEESEYQTCPPGVSVNIWNVCIQMSIMLFYFSFEKDITSCGKRSGYGNDLFVCLFVFSSQQLENEDKWKELTQYFGINDRFESPVDSRAPQKSGLELSIEKCVAEGDIARAEELSDRLAIRELGVKIAKAAACRNFVKAKQEAEAAQEAQKKKKLAWGFEAKKRWETKSNMGYM
ncbi:F204A protein, partial [Leiothrix lutea]|nr:F204A protein [Leiothrix lutea]